MSNIDPATVAGFGDEWKRFDQSGASSQELDIVFDAYFSVFPWEKIPENAVGFDLGCGSGRWAERVCPRVGHLHCIDASADALGVAKAKLHGFQNASFHHASVDQIPLDDQSMDFGYSLGVLHHVPDTRAGIAACVKKLKVGAPFLVYLYYAFDNRPLWFKMLWRASEFGRRFISRMPFGLRAATTTAVAALVYWPLARLAGALEKVGLDVSNWPLSYYRHLTFYSMRTDALDRFGTRLEQRFSRRQIQEMMQSAGLDDITFYEGAPYWCAMGYRKPC